jgi:exodeoxyribonuclease VII small subunit
MPEPEANGQRPVEELTFEQAYAELEQTAQALQQGQLSLDDTLKLYERGSFLSRYCLQKLDGVELKVTQLLARADGTYALKSITSEKDVTPPEPPPEPAGAPPEVEDDLQEQKELFD